MPQPSTFQDRAPREAVNFPVHFTADDGSTFDGICENLSESGLLALFPVPPDIWLKGTLDLHFGTDLLGIRARVARVVGPRAGFAFVQADKYRETLSEMMWVARRGGTLLQRL